jgi:hypothetical protein
MMIQSTPMAQASLVESLAGTQNLSNRTRLFWRACARGRIRRLWAWITGRSSRLLDISEVCQDSSFATGRHAGIQSVPIAEIRASEGRSDDFDGDFAPLTSRIRGRWTSVLAARQRGVALPAVELIQIDDLYVVRDGHHRISVARAIGEQFIEARVTVWK